MKFFVKRRTNFQGVTIALSALTLFFFATYSPVLITNSYHSGWTLFVLFTLLALYNVRKKLPYPPLFTSSSWLQFHIYGGTLGAIVFLIHVTFQMPTGLFDSLLFWNVVLLILTGFLGLWLSRALPKRMTDVGQEVIFERIPQFRLQCLQQADELILQIVEKHSNEALENFYLHSLRPYLCKEPNCIKQFFSTNRSSQTVITGLANLERYLNDEEKSVAKSLRAIVRQRADLDDHFAYQHILKGWLFFHIPLSFSLIVLLFVHLVLVYAF